MGARLASEWSSNERPVGVVPQDPQDPRMPAGLRPADGQPTANRDSGVCEVSDETRCAFVALSMRFRRIVAVSGYIRPYQAVLVVLDIPLYHYSPGPTPLLLMGASIHAGSAEAPENAVEP